MQSVNGIRATVLAISTILVSHSVDNPKSQEGAARDFNNDARQHFAEHSMLIFT